MTSKVATVEISTSTAEFGEQVPIWGMPLTPVALALTLGIVADRLLVILLPFSMGFALACLAAWVIQQRADDKGLAILYLWGAAAGLGASYHHWHRDIVPTDDIRHLAALEPRPVRVAGIIAAEPIYTPARNHPLQSTERPESTKWVLQVRRLHDGLDWLPASGLVQATGPGTLKKTVHVGDEVEMVGNLSLPPGPANPGEFDYADYLGDQRIGAVLAAKGSPESVTLWRQGWPASLMGWLGVVRAWAKEVLERKIAAPYHTIAWALLLGDGSGMTGDDWDIYLRTGVIHVLAISGQHLVVLAGFIWFVLRLGGISTRQGAVEVAVFLLGYALLTGARPAVMRAAWTVLAYCGGMMLGRRVLPANVFALAWIGVLLVNPTDIFNTGCQLSFLAVAMLFWGTRQDKEGEPDALKQVIEESRPWIVRQARMLLRWVGRIYFVNLIIWLAVSPLAASRFHVVSPVALLIGPLMVLFTSIALMAGFLLLLTSWLGPLCWPFAIVTQGCLAVCQWIVQGGANLPGAFDYVADIPDWWLAVFYLGLATWLTAPFARRWGWWLLGGGMVMVFYLILAQAGWWRTAEFRCTFLAVGHGGCTVIETPDGRVAIYDVGSLAGPDLVRRHVAPYLWWRGYRAIDEVFLSHADLDHFNGLSGLVERFRIHRVAMTPSFAGRQLESVRHTLTALTGHGVEVRTIHAGERWDQAGVSWQVLHPPAQGPEGKENARSMVVRIQYQGTSILLTGDLEEPGLSQVLGRSITPVEVLMAPHHGSLASNTPALAKWARPNIVISSQAPPRFNARVGENYEKMGAQFLATWWHGSITIRSDQGNAWVETYRTKLTLPLRQAASQR